MSVHYKFKSTLDFDTVSFDGLHISVADLKKAIFHQKRLGKNTDFDLQITNAQTKEDYTDDNALIAKNTSLIIARIPLTVQQKKSWDRHESQSFSNSKDESSMGHTVDLTRLDGSEEDKIRAMMTQSTQDYDPSNYMKIRGANQTGEVPPNYRCYKCHQPGHWIKNCPLGVTQEPIEIKKSTGIPRSFMVPVEGPLVPGAMMTPTGHYAVPAIDHQAYKEGKKERPPFFQDPEPVDEKPEIPEDLICSICKDLLTDAVMVPCCGNSYCDECIRSSLLESEEHECPGCNEKDVSPETLIPNRYLRGNVLQFNNKTGYAKKTPYRPTAQSQASINETDKTESGQGETPQETSKASPPTEDTSVPLSIAPATKELTPVLEIPEHIVPPIADEGSEVVPPPPPGTEPLLPIPSVSKSPEKESVTTEAHHPERGERHDNDYGGDYGDYEEYEEDRRPRERHRSYSKEGQHERTGDGGRRIENIRSMNRRRSLSPRQRQDYQPHGTQLPHMMNQSKGYQNMPPGNQQRYPSNMHYDLQLRRSTEDRPGTPTVDEPHSHSQSVAPLLPYPPGEECIPPPPPQNYNQPPPRMAPHNPPLLPDPYMGHRMPMYSHQQGPHYGPPRYDRPPYQQPGYRSSQPPRNYNGPPRPMRGMHHRGYRGMQPPPPGLGRSMHNGNPPGVIDDPLEAFERMLREKDERDRRLGKHRRRSRTRSRSRSYTRSRSRSFSRRSPLPSRLSRSRSPPPKRRASRSPPRRSRTPKRRSRSGSFSMSRSRSYSRSQSPRGSIPRDRERERERERDRDRERDLPPRYRTPVRSPPRFQRDRERERDRPRSREPPRDSREQYSSYYNDSPANEYGLRERDISNRERGSRYPPRNQTTSHNIPPLLPHAMPMGAPQQPERKDYYDSYNSRYGGGQTQRFNSPVRDHKRFDDVAPPGTEGYYDLPPPGVDHPERSRDDRDRSRITKDVEDHGKDGDGDDRLRDDRVRDRDRDREDRDRRPIERDRDNHREREKDDRDKPAQREKDDRKEKDRERDDRHPRDRRDDDRQSDRRDYEMNRYRDDRDRHRIEEKPRGREKDRKERDYDFEKDRDRHERHSADHKKSKKSSSPHPPKSRSENKDLSPERPKKKEKDHEEKSEEKKKEKKIKDKKKKKDSEEKEKKKKKKKEKKTLRELAKNESAKLAAESDNFSVEPKPLSTPPELKAEDINEDPPESIETNVPIVSSLPTDFDDKSLTMNPEPPEFPEDPLQQIDSELGQNPPNPNFKPIPELKTDMKPIESLYDGLDDTEINTVITEKYTFLPEIDKDSKIESQLESPKNPDDNLTSVSRTTPPGANKSPKKDEFLAPLPELSKWERDDTIEKTDENIPVSPQPTELATDDPKSTKIVTSEVLKRAENAIFQKAINAIRPIEIKKISESRKILYQNPEPKIEPEINRERKSVNVTINVGRNERNVEITDAGKKGKLDRSKFKGDTHSPTRLSAKERLGDKIEDDMEKKPMMKQFNDKKEFIKTDDRNRSKSPKLRDRKISPLLERRVEPPLSLNTDRKVFLEDRKHRPIRLRDDSGVRPDKFELRDTKPEPKVDFRQPRNDQRSESRIEKERQVRTPPSYKRDDTKLNPLKRKSEELEVEKKKDKKIREEKKRKKEHRSRSKSRDRKRKKDKKHKKDKEKSMEKKHKHKEEKAQASEEKIDPDSNPGAEPVLKKQRKNPRLVSDRKRLVLDEANFEPDYSASDSESDGEEGKTVKKPKLEDVTEGQEKLPDTKVAKRRVKSTSSDDDSSSTESSSSDTDSSEDSHRKRKKKHKKHKKRKVRKESSSDSDSYSDSSDSSSEEERHKKKSKKSKSKSKQSKKKKKSKHK